MPEICSHSTLQYQVRFSYTSLRMTIVGRFLLPTSFNQKRTFLSLRGDWSFDRLADLLGSR